MLNTDFHRIVLELWRPHSILLLVVREKINTGLYEVYLHTKKKTFVHMLHIYHSGLNKVK